MNSFNVYYKENKNAKPWNSIAGKVTVPFSYANLLDERLDESYLTIYKDSKPYYKPTTEFKISVTADTENGSTAKDFYYIVGDDKAIELPLGSGKYKHELYLIELTKLLEGVLCQSLTFTNQKGKKKNENIKDNTLSQGSYSWNFTHNKINYISSAVKRVKIDGIFENYLYLQEYELPSPKTVYDMLEIKDNGTNLKQELVSATVCIRHGTTGDVEKTLSQESNSTVKMQADWEGAKNLVYDLKIKYESTAYEVLVVFAVEVFDRLFPLKRLTIKDCVDRVLSLAKPLFAYETPEYKLNKAQGEELEKILAPEFSMTQCTLREQLKTIGGYIHSEPRLRYAANGSKEIWFEKYTLNTEAKTANKSYAHKGFDYSINNYCTEIRSNAQNLVSSLGADKGAVSDPDIVNFRSLRTENTYVRLEKEDAIVETQYPIYSIEKVYCYFAGDLFKEDDETSSIKDPSTGGAIDITDYVYEEANYRLLSSFSGGYSKSRAIYFTQGQKHLRGLFYQTPNPVDNSLSSYAISNILAQLLKNNNTDSIISNAIHALCFQITYKPVFNATVTHTNGFYSPGETNFAMLYNQSDNYVETQFFGEHLKGVAKRLGNVEQTRTYILKDFSLIPSPGETIDGYVISAVNVNMFPTYIKLTVALSKDFNRISQYVGVNSIKRSYEISERQVSERDVYLKEYLVIGKTESPANCKLFAPRPSNGNDILRAFSLLFTLGSGWRNGVCHTKISMAYIRMYDSENRTRATIRLPVVTSSFGNTIGFYFKFKDNYSAGNKIEYYTADAVKGAWMEDVPAVDINGRVEKIHFALHSFPFDMPSSAPANLPEANEISFVGIDFPFSVTKESATFVGASTDYIGKYILKKDNRESLSFSVNLELKSNRTDLIIGSGLAALCPLITSEKRERPTLYLVTEEFDRMATSIIGLDKNAISNTKYNIKIESGEIKFDATENLKFADASVKGWLIAMPLTSKEIQFEEGAYQTVYEGGEILLRCTTPPQNYAAGSYAVDEANEMFFTDTNFSIVRE